MNRSLLLGLVAALALPAAAQSADSTATTTPDSMAADSVQAFVPNTQQARALYDEALALGRAGNYADALLKYEESLLSDPAFAPSTYGRATSLARLGRLDDSRTAFETSVAAARAADNAAVLEASERGLAEVQAALTAQAANAAAAAQAAAIQLQTDAVAEATAILNAETVSAEAAQQAFDALERAREAGYDANLAAYYYAKALLLLERGAEAVSFAQTALDVADPASDRSGLYVQLGLAQRAAGNMDAARAAFESGKTGSWSTWAEHYIREMGQPMDPSNAAVPN